MNTVTDPVFGKMSYRHSWKGQRDIPGIGSILITAQAYTGEGISESQRSAFQTFLSTPQKYMDDACSALEAYFAKVYPKLDFKKIFADGTFHPTSILFCQNGIWGFIYPSPIGDDDGISVRFEQGQAIADTDDALF